MKAFGGGLQISTRWPLHPQICALIPEAISPAPSLPRFWPGRDVPLLHWGLVSSPLPGPACREREDWHDCRPVAPTLESCS